jgi:predicted dehydrogenase
MRDHRIGFGLAGLGRISRAHRRGFRQAAADARLVAVCDVDRLLANHTGDELGVRAYADLDEMLEASEVEAVNLALPHNLHSPALEAGKHVLIEKPMAPTAAECSDLIALARAKGLSLGIAENTRFVGAYIEAERILRQGKLGTPRLVRTFIYGSSIVRLGHPPSWKSRASGTIGGTIFDAGPHSFYLLAWLFGDFAQLQATMNRIVGISEVEDHGLVTGRMANGMIFSMEYNFTAEVPWGERLEIYGSEGTLIVASRSADAVISRPDRCRRRSGFKRPLRSARVEEALDRGCRGGFRRRRPQRAATTGIRRRSTLCDQDRGSGLCVDPRGRYCPRRQPKSRVGRARRRNLVGGLASH